ncbi:MAG: UDP-N-acetylmuramate--L-alanine ligase, partial [Rikenellaceae bacterium]|nr:UDP-N-acetylmuramate--L-alanine ligase [Rikenellaceae bacterium]
LILKHGVELPCTPDNVDIYTYSLDDAAADFHAVNCRADSRGCYMFDIVCPDMVIKDCHLGIPGYVNVENCVGATAMIWVAGFDRERLRQAMTSFRGVARRLDVRYHGAGKIYIDDYAHHPEELRKTIQSVRGMFPGKSITAVFQPHLYTRTRDFWQGFAQSLSMVDRLVLLPIYPAREEPIEGVDSRLILDAVTIADKSIVSKEGLLDVLAADSNDILITFGAGDIDRFVEPISLMLSNRE